MACLTRDSSASGRVIDLPRGDRLEVALIKTRAVIALGRAIPLFRRVLVGLSAPELGSAVSPRAPKWARFGGELRKIYRSTSCPQE